MFNEKPFNQQQFNSVSQVLTTYYESLNFYILYNGFYISDNINFFASIKYLWPKEIDADNVDFNLNFWNFYNVQEKQKQIKIGGTITATDRNDLLEKIKQLKSKCLNQNQYLIIKDGAQKYQMKCLCKSITFPEYSYNIAWMDFEMTFLTYDYLQDYAPNNGYINITSNSYSFTIQNWGTAESKYFLILNFLAASTTVNLSINIWGNIITFTEVINAWDIVLLDYYNNKITRNAANINFTWELLGLDPGDTTVTVTTNGTVNIDLLYKTNYAYK